MAASLLDFKKGFDVDNIIFEEGNDNKIKIKNPFRSPLLQTNYPPKQNQNKQNDVSICVEESDKNSTFKDKIDFIIDKVRENTSGISNIKYQKFWYNNTFYIKIKKTTPVVNKNDETIDVSDIGTNSLIVIDFNINTFYSENKNTMYFIINVNKVYVINHKLNDGKSMNTGERETILPFENYCLNVTPGFKLDPSIPKNDVFPIHPVETFNPELLKFSDIKGDNIKTVYLNYNGSIQRVKISFTKIPIDFIIKNPEHNSVKMILPLKPGSLFEIIQDNYFNHLSNHSEKIWNKKYSMENIEELVDSFCFSSTDENKMNPRLKIKIPMSNEGVPMCKFFVANHETSTIEEGKIESIDEIEKVLKNGTFIDEMIVNLSISIVNTNPYFTFSLDQILLDPSKPCKRKPTISGCPFKDIYDKDNEQLKNPTREVVFITDDTKIDFGEYDDKNKNFTISSSDRNIKFFGQPSPIKNLFTIETEDDPTKNKYPYSLKFEPNEDVKKFLNMIHENFKSYCTENSKKFFKKNLSKEILNDMIENNGPYKVKEEKEYITGKIRVKDNFINLEAWKADATSEKGKYKIRPLKIESENDLVSIFHRGAYIQPIFTLQGSCVNNIPRISLVIFSVLYFGTENPSEEVSITPFDFSSFESIKTETTQEKENVNETEKNQSESESDEEEESDDE